MTPAGKKPTAESAQALFTSLCEAGCPLRSTGVKRGALESDSAAALAAATRLLEYRGYLSQARKYKASGKGRPGDIDKQVLVEARGALRDAKALTLLTVNAVGNLSRGGTLDQMTESWRQSVAAAGSVSMVDLWRHVIAEDKNRELIRKAGVDDALMEALGEVVKASEMDLSADGSRLVVAGLVNGAAVNRSLTTTPRPGRASNVSDLLMRGRFDAISAALQRDEPAFLYGVPLIENDARAEDVALSGALDAYQEGVRHVRKLEDTGLEIYLGGSPGIVVAIIVGMLIVGIYLASQYCDKQGFGPGTDPDARQNCGIGALLIVIATAIILGGKSSQPGTTPVNLSLGSVLVRGAVRDLQLSAS